MKTIGKWTSINLNVHGKIRQAAVILKESTNLDEAKVFYNFLFSERAREILNKYGYLTPEEYFYYFSSSFHSPAYFSPFAKV